MKKRCYSICIILWVLITTLSATSPTTFHIALKKIYPHATNVSWSQQGNYYVASFTQNGFEKEVWMNGNAQWVMTNTDLQTTDQLTPNVYNDFTLSPYAMWTATNVNLIEFPKRTTLYVITVNLNNSSATKQLFYTLNGRLLQTRDVSYINPTYPPESLNSNTIMTEQITFPEKGHINNWQTIIN